MRFYIQFYNRRLRLYRFNHSLALTASCFCIVSATIRRWILPVAVLGIVSEK